MTDLGPVAWPPEPIKTERLLLRAPEARDRTAFIDLLASPEVHTYLGGARPRAELEREMHGVPERWPGNFVVDLDGAMIGQILLRRATEHSRPAAAGKADLGYLFLPRAWGFGYAAEACAAALDWFDGVLPGESVVLTTQSANVGSMRLAAKLGFTEVERFQAWDAEQWLGLRTDAGGRFALPGPCHPSGAVTCTPTNTPSRPISASALRLTPDEWQIALFGDQNPPDKRDLVEGKLVQLGMRAAEPGTNVVFDFGFWGKDERSALRWVAGAVGARSQVVYLPIDHEEQRRRVTNRFATTPDQTWHMSDVELEQWRTQFQAPDDEELPGSQIPTVPPEHATWSEWASLRWPSLPDQYAPTAANSAVVRGC